jgi:uncharacterized membrane protein
MESQKTKILNIPKQILLLLLLTIVLNLTRFIVFQSTYYIYLFWNIFLAIIPFIISSFLLHYTEKNKLKQSLLIAGGILWLLTLPNAPYIVTDLIHLGRNHNAPLLYDTFLIFSAAWVGMILFMYSLSHVEKILRYKYSEKITSLAIVAITFLTSFGMYLGRFMRFNSWDVFSDASLIFTNVSNIVTKPNQYMDAYLFTGISFVFIYTSYRAWKYSEVNRASI